MAQPLDLRSRKQGVGGDRHEGLVPFLGTRASRTHEQSASFSKKFSKHLDMMHLFAVHYNSFRIHSNPHVTLAMEAGLSGTPMGCDWIVWLIDSMTLPTKKSRPRKSTKYRPRKT